ALARPRREPRPRPVRAPGPPRRSPRRAARRRLRVHRLVPESEPERSEGTLRLPRVVVHLSRVLGEVLRVEDRDLPVCEVALVDLVRVLVEEEATCGTSGSRVAQLLEAHRSLLREGPDGAAPLDCPVF